MKPTNDKLYGGNLSLDNIHYYLRDNVAHKEPDASDRRYFKKRQKYINQLSVQKIYKSIEASLHSCKGVLLNMNKDMLNLTGFIKKYTIG
jgi:hypothetical protein